MIDELVHLVTKRVVNQHHSAHGAFPPITSRWSNYERSQPTVVVTEYDRTEPPLHFSAPKFEGDLNDTFDEKALLKKVPKPFKRKAEALLKEFDARPNDITWDAAGNLYINENSIPNANFQQLFPCLLCKRAPKNLPGMPDLIEKLNAMNLGHLIYQHTAPSQDQSTPLPALTNWWFLGE